MDENTLNGAVEKLKNMLSSEDGQSQLQDIIGMFAGGADSGEPDAADEQADSGFDAPDMETIFKIQQAVNAVNSGENSRHTQFLRSLRPYLKESRQKKLDSAVKLLGAASAMKMLGIFKNGDGDS